MSDTSNKDERTVCWGLDEYLWGYTAGGGASGKAPCGAQHGRQAPTECHQLVGRTWAKGEADSAPFWLYPRHHQWVPFKLSFTGAIDTGQAGIPLEDGPHGNTLNRPAGARGAVVEDGDQLLFLADFVSTLSSTLVGAKREGKRRNDR